MTKTRKVLDLLVQGKIDADQAEELLTAIAEPAPAPRRTTRPAGDHAGLRLTVEDLVELASNGVDADYVKALAQAGLANVSVSDIVELASNGVEAEYIRELTDAGLEGLTVEQIVELADNGVDPKLAEAFRRGDVTDQ